MEIIALLRGVTPVGKNKIPKMADLAERLTEVGFTEVRTYGQSGNIILETPLSLTETANLIQQTIFEKIGADLSVITKTKKEFTQAITNNPFPSSYDFSRILLVFTNHQLDPIKVNRLRQQTFTDEKLHIGKHCVYLYVPREATKKKLNTNYLEKYLGIVATSRKLRVIQLLCQR